MKKFTERTLVLIKPDGVEKRLIGEIISRFERAGLKIIGLGMVKASKKMIDKHYPKDRAWIENLGYNLIKTIEELNLDFDWEKEYNVKNVYELGLKIRNWLIDFMVSGPLVKILLEGPQAIFVVRKIVGKTLPYLAEPGTIRGDYSLDTPILANFEKRAVKNLVHASTNKKEAEKEVKIWFSKKEIVQW